MKRLCSIILAVVMIVGMMPVFAASSYEVEYSAIITNPDLKQLLASATTTNSDLIYPTADHPRVFLNEEYINYLVENKDNEVYKDNFTYLMAIANKDLPELPEDGMLKDATSTQLVTRALMYALGQVSKSHARKTADYTLQYLANPQSSQTAAISRYKDFGTNAMQTAALVYDWCYDALSAAQRSALAELVRNEMYRSEQPCRPDNLSTGWSDISGKAVGQPLVYNSISAIAIYDEYPEIYEAIMPRIQGTMAEIMRTFGGVGALNDGSLAYCREYYSYYVALLFERMGYPDFYGDQSKIGYKFLYSRLPYGAFVKQGDDFSQTAYTMGQYTNSTSSRMVYGFLSTMYQDPYLRQQYLKENSAAKGWEALLLMETDVEAKLSDDLPLAYYIDQPKSEILARTSWQDGLDSPAVSALMSIHNRRTGDHDHGHIGEFQLYYKGPLTMPAGHYQGGDADAEWGAAQWKNYFTRSVAANCMAVYDPSEVFFMNINPTEANDGGQLMVRPKADNGSSVIASAEEQLSDGNIWATTEAHYIGPNDKTPAFSYIKGDLTNAYAAKKMNNYKRGMVFMDTFNETYPGVLVVFDRVAATSASYEKRWQLQSVTEPEVNGNKITIVNTEDGANGKLVNTTLLPEEVDIERIGDVGRYVVGDKEYKASNKASDVYKGGIRLEVSPKNEEKTDIFVNAMYVTDADGNAAELPMIKEETKEFVGVTTLDRMVLFSRSGEQVKDSFEVTVRSNGYDEMLCFITDVADGNWCIEGNGQKMIVAADKDGHSLTFKAKPGTYTVSPSTSEAQEFTFAEAKKEKIGDFTVKLGTMYSYVKHPNKVVDGVPYIALADFMERYMEATCEQNGDTLTVKKSDGGTVILTAGKKEYLLQQDGQSRGGGLMTDGAPFMEDGVMYVNLKGSAAALGFGSAGWKANAKVYNLVAAEGASAKTLDGVDESRVLWPQVISTSSGDLPGENVVDRDLETRWSCNPGDGEWICCDMGETVEFTEVLISWYNGDKRNWLFDIQVSDDNVNFTNVITGGRSSGTTKGVESYPVPSGTKGRYIRLVGHGEEVTATMNCSPTEFIILK